MRKSSKSLVVLALFAFSGCSFVTQTMPGRDPHTKPGFAPIVLDAVAAVAVGGTAKVLYDWGNATTDFDGKPQEPSHGRDIVPIGLGVAAAALAVSALYGLSQHKDN
jgi:hypothetical protein